MMQSNQAKALERVYLMRRKWYFFNPTVSYTHI